MANKKRRDDDGPTWEERIDLLEHDLHRLDRSQSPLLGVVRGLIVLVLEVREAREDILRAIRSLKPKPKKATK